MNINVFFNLKILDVLKNSVISHPPCHWYPCTSLNYYQSCCTSKTLLTILSLQGEVVGSCVLQQLSIYLGTWNSVNENESTYVKNLDFSGGVLFLLGWVLRWIFCSPSWPQTLCVAGGDLEFIIILPLCPEFWNIGLCYQTQKTWIISCKSCFKILLFDVLGAQEAFHYGQIH